MIRQRVYLGSRPGLGPLRLCIRLRLHQGPIFLDAADRLADVFLSHVDQDGYDTGVVYWDFDARARVSGTRRRLAVPPLGSSICTSCYSHRLLPAMALSSAMVGPTTSTRSQTLGPSFLIVLDRSLGPRLCAPAATGMLYLNAAPPTTTRLRTFDSLNIDMPTPSIISSRWEIG